MRALYEIDQNILDCVDLETGEILDSEMLTALQMEREKKLEAVACWVKDMAAEIEARREEIRKQQTAVKYLEGRIAGCKEWLRQSLGGEKFKTAKVSVSYTHNQRLVVPDEAGLIEFCKTLDDPERFLRFKEPELRKDDIKKALKADIVIPGASLEETESVVIK